MKKEDKIVIKQIYDTLLSAMIAINSKNTGSKFKKICRDEFESNEKTLTKYFKVWIDKE